jgi:hypothetical protein
MYLHLYLQEVQLLGQLIPEECPADDKPMYGSVVAAVAKVSDTNMYYLADPATGRKVVSGAGAGGVVARHHTAKEWVCQVPPPHQWCGVIPPPAPA